MRLLSLLLLGLLAALPARAENDKEPATLLTALGQIPADPAWWGDIRVVDIVDLAALRQISGVGPSVTLADFADKRLSDADELAATSLLWRLSTAAGFVPYLLTGATVWQEQLGVDFLALDWFTQPGTPPRTLLILGGGAAREGAALVALSAASLAPVERGGTVVWFKNDNDYGQDIKNREPGFPFWGMLGSAVRIFRGEHALVGARSWPDLDLALAVERDEADSLADLPRYRLAAAAAGHVDYSSGPILQMTFIDQAVGRGIGTRADGLPPYELLAFADREDASGHHVVLVLTYGTDAETAAAVAALLPERLSAWRDKGGTGIADRFPGLSVKAAPLKTEDGAAAVAVLSMPPLPVMTENGKVQNRSLLYGLFQRMLWTNDIVFLAPRG